MAKSPPSPSKAPTAPRAETHQTADDSGGVVLTTNQGIPVSDNQNALTVGPRGPTLLEDFVLREKITHFDHERIPERIVHARGSAAHGYFELTQSLAAYTTADFLQRPGDRVPVFARFSTVAGGAGSVDLPRDVRGFAVKFYTGQGNFDLVGNNIPVFFIQDAMKFPDLVHAVKMEPHTGYPQAASAHDNFWDFISLTPESFHMIMWAMSDRAIPRSLRMMEGFGVHTFRMVNAEGASTFVKWHWRPTIGSQSVVWDEAVKISGADPDFHRRDLHEAIKAGDFPEWELGLQLFTQDEADGFDFDVLDPTKIIPEEVVPLIVVGRLVLDRNPDNFFAETEQVAFCPANIVPGLDFSNDPLLQGRLFSYLDTQLIRLGGPNFHQIPINAPKCPFANHQRDGHMQMMVPKGRVNYEPNSFDPQGPRESPSLGFRTFPSREEGDKVRLRPESFADHFSQARQFYLSQTPPEQDHIAAALIFELSKVETPAVRERVLSRVINIDKALATRVAKGLGMPLPAPAETPVGVKDLPPSPPLSLLAKAKATLAGRKVGVLVAEGADARLLAAVTKAVKAQGGKVEVVAETIGGVTLDDGTLQPVHHRVDGGPSVLFDAVAVIGPKPGAERLGGMAAAQTFVRDAYGHLKVIGVGGDFTTLFHKAGLTTDDNDAGFVGLMKPADAKTFADRAAAGRIWEREPKVRPLP
ncbi:MAG: Catalase [Caulobacter sp.]|nr:Catalase [Caulobacter sp.]